MQINFKELLEVQSYSYQEKRMNRYITSVLDQMADVTYHLDKVKTGVNIYITKNSNSSVSFPCVVAHTDTVHKIVENLTCIEVSGAYTGINSATMSQTGIGGDDKVGIYVALRMLNELPACKVAFFHAEEVGTVGSRSADLDFFKDCRFVLQCDRKGNKDFVTEIGWTELSSKEWQDDVQPIIEKYGYSFSDGGITDVGELKDLGLTIPVANMSCGYYNPHCSDEFIVIEDVNNVIELVRDICTNITKQYYHKAEYNYKSSGYGYNYNRYGSSYYDDFYDDYAKPTYEDKKRVGDWIYFKVFDNWYHVTDVWEDSFGVLNVRDWAVSLSEAGFGNPYECLVDYEDTSVHTNCEVCLDFLNAEGECQTCKEMEEKGMDIDFLRNNDV